MSVDLTRCRLRIPLRLDPTWCHLPAQALPANAPPHVVVAQRNGWCKLHRADVDVDDCAGEWYHGTDFLAWYGIPPDDCGVEFQVPPDLTDGHQMHRRPASYRCCTFCGRSWANARDGAWVISQKISESLREILGTSSKE